MSGCRRNWWVLTVRYGHTIRMNEIRHPSTLIPAAHGLSSLTLDAHRRFTLSLLKHTQRRRTFAARPVFAWRVGRTCLMSSERPDSGPLCESPYLCHKGAYGGPAGRPSTTVRRRPCAVSGYGRLLHSYNPSTVARSGAPVAQGAVRGAWRTLIYLPTSS